MSLFRVRAACGVLPLLLGLGAAWGLARRNWMRRKAARQPSAMARMAANDEYGIALLADAHQPKQPGSLQWAVAFWHRATAYQQLGQWAQAEGDLPTADDTLTKAIAAVSGDAPRSQHFAQLRQRVRAQRADMLERLGKHSEAQRERATQ